MHPSALQPDPDAGRGPSTLTEAQHCVTIPGNVGRRVPAAHDLEYPEVPFPASSLLQQMGVAALRSLVRRQHELVRTSAVGYLLSSNDQAFASAVRRIEDYVVESCGGAADYTAGQGAVCMRTRHFALAIDEAGREIWLDCLWRAMEEAGLPAAQREALWDWLEPMSIRMINRRTTKAQPRRYPFAWLEARARLPALGMCRK